MLLLNHEHVFSTFSCSKLKCLTACALSSFTNFRVVDAILTITVKDSGVRVAENLGVSLLTGKNSKPKKSTAVKDHMLSCDNIISTDDFKILAISDSDLHI